MRGMEVSKKGRVKMKKRVLFAVLISGGLCNAALLVEEAWNYEVGSSTLSEWTGGTGYGANLWTKTADAQATIVSGLTFGSMQVSGGAVRISMQAPAANTGHSISRKMNIDSLTSGDLWVSYLFQFDTAGSTLPNNEAVEIRPQGASNTRNGIHEYSSAVTLRYGTDSTTSATNAAIKNGTTLLFIVKYPDLGAETGSDARVWGLTAAEYESVISGGITEAKLNAFAGIQATNSFSPNETLSGTQSTQFYMNGRNSSTPSFIIDEYRLGTSLESVVAIPEPATIGLFIVTSGFLMAFRRMKTL